VIDTEMAHQPYGRDAEAAAEIGEDPSAGWRRRGCAGPIVFLCSELARHITGEVLNVNGGSVLCG
jgi:3-oxoacyl-[acyl-carrier protein] reductase